MINLKLANILTDIAEIKKSTGVSKDITLNLMVAARTIRDNPESIKKVYSGGRLKELFGMEGLAYKLIVEYMETGKIKLYEELKSKYTEDLIRLIRISGFGKTKMFKIYEALNIKNLEDLKEKLAYENINDKISSILIEGNSYKNKDGVFYVKRLKSSLNYIESIKGLYPRWQVELYLDEIKNSLYKIRDIKKILIVGSLRRKKSLVRDIDILILPNFNNESCDFSGSARLLEEIKSLKFIKSFKGNDIRPGSISARFETVFGIEVEIIISNHKNWSVDVLYTTGNKEHVRKLEEIAGKRGCVKNGRIEINNSIEVKKQQIENCLSNSRCFEEDIYNMLDLQYIPPELRENQGEIELSKSHLLPPLLTMDDIKGDLHVHSTWSDGVISLEDMIERIKKFNYEYMAITDHSVSNYYGSGLDDKRIQEKINYIDKLKSQFKDFCILMGSEIDITGVNKFDYPQNIIKKMDIAIGSMHSSFLNTEAKNTARVISAVENKYIDFIAHPTGVVFGNRAPYFIDIDQLITAAVKNNKALEINSYFLRMDLNEQNARKAAKMGAKVVINTDAHRPNNMDMIRLGVDIARRAGFKKENVLNTFSLAELKAWKGQRS